MMNKLGDYFMASDISLEKLFINLVLIFSSSFLLVNSALKPVIYHISNNSFVLLPG
jgi:hypothetical protein